MRMATRSNMGFHQTTVPSSSYSRHMVSFQPGVVSNSASVISTGMNVFGGVNSTIGMVFNEDPSGMDNKSTLIPVGSPSGGLHVDPVPGLKYDTGLAADWSFEEQAFLEEGLVKYAHEPNIMKYIKVAAMLQDKTVRDVALRCCWMMKKESGKRCKQEECYTGKKMKDKEKQVDFSSRVNIPSSQLSNVASCSFMMHCMDNKSSGILCQGPVIDGATQYLLEENAQVLGQIRVNLDNLKLQDNTNLLFYTKNNIATILNRMSEMPGIMSQMPPLPVAIDDELVSVLLLGTPQGLIFGATDSIHLKHEPRY